MSEKLIKFNKPSGSIAVSHKLTQVQWHTYNILLANAYLDLELNKRYTITVRDFATYLPSATARSKIEGYLRVLAREGVEFNILKKDKKVWGVFSFIQEPEIEDGVISYKIPDRLTEAMMDSNSPFAPINLQVQRKYRGSSYGWILYELCFDYRNTGSTGKISLEKLRSAFGVDTKSYPLFKNFNRRVLSKAIKDVNVNTSLHIKETLHKTGRKVSAVTFKVIQEKQITSPATETLMKLGVNENTAFAVVSMHGESYILSILEMHKDELATGQFKNGTKIKSKAAYILDRIKNIDKNDVKEFEQKQLEQPKPKQLPPPKEPKITGMGSHSTTKKANIIRVNDTPHVLNDYGISTGKALELEKEFGIDLVNKVLEKWKPQLDKRVFSNGKPITTPSGLLIRKIEEGDWRLSKREETRRDKIKQQNEQEAKHLQETKERERKQAELLEEAKIFYRGISNHEERFEILVRKYFEIDQEHLFHRLGHDEIEELRDYLIQNVFDTATYLGECALGAREFIKVLDSRRFQQQTESSLKDETQITTSKEERKIRLRSIKEGMQKK
jgi:hypothetical protein